MDHFPVSVYIFESLFKNKLYFFGILDLFLLDRGKNFEKVFPDINITLHLSTLFALQFQFYNASKIILHQAWNKIN